MTYGSSLILHVKQCQRREAIFISVEKRSVMGQMSEDEGMRNTSLRIDLPDIVRKLAVSQATTLSF